MARHYNYFNQRGDYNYFPKIKEKLISHIEINKCHRVISLVIHSTTFTRGVTMENIQRQCGKGYLRLVPIVHSCVLNEQSTSKIVANSTYVKQKYTPLHCSGIISGCIYA